MNNKIVTLLALSTVSILTACGGGGESDSEGSTSSNSVPDGTRYYSITYSQENHSDGFDGSYEEVKNGQILDTRTDKSVGAYILTSSRLYTPKDNEENHIQVHSLNKWTYTWIGNLKKEVNFEVVNLSGVNIFDTLIPGARTEGFSTDGPNFNGQYFLNNDGNLKFPAGSQCLRVVSQKYNQDAFVFNTTDEDRVTYSDGSTYSFEDYDAENKDFINYLNQTDPYGFQYKYLSGNWQGIPWTTIYEVDSGVSSYNTTAVKYQNQNYHADYNSAVEWKAVNEIKQYEIILNKSTSLTEEQRKSMRRSIAELKLGCVLFNESAAKAVTSIASISWNN
ncbi:hypothetical protein [Acinetobacter gerneri]|uniref:hypothetical protein n=1 Tax=Acinetobacter gerneri TaxID=202952 RepID=UPI0028A71A0C|nr:hypothetical protein [Acinetobacter gerneri]